MVITAPPPLSSICCLFVQVAFFYTHRSSLPGNTSPVSFSFSPYLCAVVLLASLNVMKDCRPDWEGLPVLLPRHPIHHVIWAVVPLCEPRSLMGVFRLSETSALRTPLAWEMCPEKELIDHTGCAWIWLPNSRWPFWWQQMALPYQPHWDENIRRASTNFSWHSRRKWN